MSPITHLKGKKLTQTATFKVLLSHLHTSPMLPPEILEASLDGDNIDQYQAEGWQRPTQWGCEL